MFAHGQRTRQGTHRADRRSNAVAARVSRDELASASRPWRQTTATIAVKDIDRARRFYEDVVGLTPLPATNRATAATWMVDDELDDTVRTLKSKGVAFEHYDMPGITRQGDVHLTGKSKAAWFKDPDGNIIALVGR